MVLAIRTKIWGIQRESNQTACVKKIGSFSVLPRKASNVGSLTAVGGPKPPDHGKKAATAIASVPLKTKPYEADQSQHKRKGNCGNDGRRRLIGKSLHRGGNVASDERVAVCR